MQQDWSIQSRADKCAKTGEPFQDGEFFYTLLFYKKGELHREDISEAAWNERNDNVQPFSFWRSKFETTPPPPPEPLGKQTAEDLLRRYMEGGAEHRNARYILALMLERKRQIKPIETKVDDDGQRLLIYEHAKTGEVFVIPDPQLRLDQMEEVQMEVVGLLAPG